MADLRLPEDHQLYFCEEGGTLSQLSGHFLLTCFNWSGIKSFRCDVVLFKLEAWAAGNVWMVDLGLPEDPQLYCCEEGGVLGRLSGPFLLMCSNQSQFEI